MVNAIKFCDFRFTDKRIDFEAQETIDRDFSSYELYFAFSTAYRPRNDLIAVALSTLCGTKYQKVRIELELSDAVVAEIARFMSATVEAANVVPYEVPEYERKGMEKESILLSFSGGLDSLAAHALLPEAKLVSTDWLGKFEREKNFFMTFCPYVFTTNLRTRENGFNNNHSLFMMVGVILLKDLFKATAFSHGHIFEVNDTRMKEFSIPASTIITNPCSTINYRRYLVNLPLTEVVTTKLVLHNYGHIIEDALMCAAPPGREKRLRKDLLVKILLQKAGRDFTLSKPLPKPKFIFGSHFVQSFLTLYMLKNLPFDVVSLYVEGITNDVRAAVKDMKLDFYEKFNTNFFTAIPSHLRPRVASRLLEAGVQPFNEFDWSEFRRVAHLLSRWHNTV